jgi:hypothetical protein
VSMIWQAAVQNRRVSTVARAPLSSRAVTRLLSILAGLVLVYAIILSAGDLLSIEALAKLPGGVRNLNPFCA